MFPSSGFFSGIPCPYFASDLCDRPFCHFKHCKDASKIEEQNILGEVPSTQHGASSTSSLNNANGTNDDKKYSFQSQSIANTFAKLEQVKWYKPTSKGQLTKKSAQTVTKSVNAKYRIKKNLPLPVVKSLDDYDYKPTPIAKLKQVQEANASKVVSSQTSSPSEVSPTASQSSSSLDIVNILQAKNRIPQEIIPKSGVTESQGDSANLASSENVKLEEKVTETKEAKENSLKVVFDGKCGENGTLQRSSNVISDIGDTDNSFKSNDDTDSDSSAMVIDESISEAMDSEVSKDSEKPVVNSDASHLSNKEGQLVSDRGTESQLATIDGSSASNQVSERNLTTEIKEQSQETKDNEKEAVEEASQKQVVSGKSESDETKHPDSNGVLSSVTEKNENEKLKNGNHLSSVKDIPKVKDIPQDRERLADEAVEKDSASVGTKCEIGIQAEGPEDGVATQTDPVKKVKKAKRRHSKEKHKKHKKKKSKSRSKCCDSRSNSPSEVKKSSSQESSHANPKKSHKKHSKHKKEKKSRHRSSSSDSSQSSATSSKASEKLSEENLQSNSEPELKKNKETTSEANVASCKAHDTSNSEKTTDSQSTSKTANKEIGSSHPSSSSNSSKTKHTSHKSKSSSSSQSSSKKNSEKSQKNSSSNSTHSKQSSSSTKQNGSNSKHGSSSSKHSSSSSKHSSSKSSKDKEKKESTSHSSSKQKDEAKIPKKETTKNPANKENSSDSKSKELIAIFGNDSDEEEIAKPPPVIRQSSTALLQKIKSRTRSISTQNSTTSALSLDDSDSLSDSLILQSDSDQEDDKQDEKGTSPSQPQQSQVTVAKQDDDKASENQQSMDPPEDSAAEEDAGADDDFLPDMFEEEQHDVPLVDAMPAKRRVAHAGAEWIQRSAPVRPFAGRRPNAVQVMQMRFAEAQQRQAALASQANIQNQTFKRANNRSESSEPSCKRIKEEPAAPKVIDMSGQPPRRTAHMPTAKAFQRGPIIAFDTDSSKVPRKARQKFADKMFVITSQLYPNSSDASARVINEEKTVYNKSKNVNMYNHHAAACVRQLQDELRHMSQGQGPSRRGSVSHEAILGGKRAAETTYTVRRSTSYDRSANLLEGSKFHELLKEYLVQEDSLCENGFPRADPIMAGCAVIKETTWNKPAKSRQGSYQCARCQATFPAEEDGTYIPLEQCSYHPGKLWHQKVGGSWDQRYSCCGGDNNAIACALSDGHVHEQNKLKDREGYITLPACPTRHDGNYGTFALDCEMVYTTGGNEIARVTVIDEKCQVVLDKIIKPKYTVVDYNSRFSGLTAESFRGVRTSLKDVHKMLQNLLNDRSIIMGHSLENDLVALKLIHSHVVDTSLVFPHVKGPPFKRALKTLCEEYLQKIIQEDIGGHDSKEDAEACMLLMKWKIQNKLKSSPKKIRVR